MLHPVADPAGIRALDAHTIEVLGVPSLALMETAARACAEELLAAFPEAVGRGVEVVCGRGNNGGDGYAIARLLKAAGLRVRAVGLPGPHAPDAAAMRRAAEAIGVEVVEEGALDASAGVVVDALLGTGLDRPLEGALKARVEAISALGLPVLAVDMPSGLCGRTGAVLGAAVRADRTVTFGHPRLGQLLEPGASLVGRLVVVDIGLRGPLTPAAGIPDGAWVAERLPPRRADAHKGRNGHLAVVAGSPALAGAAVLACEGALRSGVGLVTLLTPPETLPRLAALPPEVMVRLVDAPGPEDLAAFDAAALGPGLGRVPWAARLWHEAALPMVFDADGLNSIQRAPSAHPRCVTPHPGEAARLLGLDPAAVQADRAGAVAALSVMGPALLKGRHTLVHDGESLTLNPTGGPAMAVAGAGDVLTGLVGGLLARGLGPADALRCGAFLHGLAGELAGDGPLLAGDIARALPSAFQGVARRVHVLERRPLLSGLGLS